ncbi:class I SAM-dependent methyltransferase [Nocardiopsis lucentensis]|uniref:class I SAM-dependent methyltransferase n=1 Tax=Nocardiopsis lucentensis TaxID=53441 RepID=UPI0003460410|nr:class I SAM-dependent methyltransferase [Nocardiopsis lucentensis]
MIHRRPVIPGDAIPSPNIWKHPHTYELENDAVDPDGVIAAAMERVRPIDDAHVLDVGCGTGYHLPGFASRARRVTGVEPHPRLAEAARGRVRGLDHVRVLDGTAQNLPVPDATVEVAHARWAYFFGPGCEPGLGELDRVMRRGGVAFVIDNDATRSTFGVWFRRSLPSYDPGAVERFWTAHGFHREALTMRWEFTDRRDFEAVVRIEFPAALAAEIIDSHRGLSVDYAVNVWWKRY